MYGGEGFLTRSLYGCRPIYIVATFAITWRGSIVVIPPIVVTSSQSSVENKLSDMLSLRTRVRYNSHSQYRCPTLQVGLTVLVLSLMSLLIVLTRYAILFSFAFSCLLFCFL